LTNNYLNSSSDPSCPRFTRNAELKALLNKNEDPYFYTRADMNWSFASQWCIYLTEAPATAELLATLRGLIEGTFIARKDEINLAFLKKWLITMPVVSARQRSKYCPNACDLDRIFACRARKSIAHLRLPVGYPFLP
jgi:hypothetical protein